MYHIYYIEGVQTLSRNDMEGMMESLFERYSARNTPAAHVPDVEQIPIPASDTVAVTYATWSWGNKIDRPVPESWFFPKGSVKLVMDLFITGIYALFTSYIGIRVSAIYLIYLCHVLHLNRCKRSQYKTIFFNRIQ